MSVFSLVGIVTTVLSFLIFVGIVVWAYGRGRRNSFAEAANAPFALPDDADSRAAAPAAGVGVHQ